MDIKLKYEIIGDSISYQASALLWHNDMMDRMRMTLPEKVEEEDDGGFKDFQLASSQEPAVIRQRNYSDNPAQGIKYPILI